MAILDLEKSETPSAFFCGIVIVGAGAVGIAMATELSRKGHQVILLEAGGVSLEQKSQDIFSNARSSGFKLDGLHSGRFRLLGGTTNFWGGQLVPFDPIVFEPRPWANSEGWPVQHATLAPYYERAMSLLGMDQAEAADSAVWERANTNPPQFNNNLELFLTRWVKMPNFARFFRADLANPRVKTIIHANVVGLEPNASGTRISRIHLRTMAGRKAIVTAGRTILACGTIEIARLLLLPYADGSEPPWHRNSWLGRGYLDHLDSTAGEVTPKDSKNFHNLFENLFFDGYKYNPKIKLTEQAQRDEELLGIAGSFIFRTGYEENAESVKLFLRSILGGKLPPNFWQLPGHAIALSRVAIPLVYRFLRDNRTFHPSGSTILFRVTSEQIPQSESRITLRQERDALDLPMLDVNWKIDGGELETIARFAEQVRASLKASGLADMKIDPALEQRNPSYLTTASDTYHQMGGARMGRNADQGVVDTDLGVYGIGGLYVAGAAVIPSSGFPNCTLTAIALGLRLCDHLAGSQLVLRQQSTQERVSA
jgi:hypothetical protein